MRKPYNTKTMLRCYWLVLSFLVGGNAVAQHAVNGTVRELSGLRPLHGATVQVDEGKQTAVTDEFGQFRLEKMPSGRHVLLIRFLGYLEQIDTITLPTTDRLDYLLEESSTVTEAVIVQSTRANESTPTTFVNVNRQQLQKQNFGQDIPLLLNWTPSVVTTSDAGTGVGYTGIRIRGSDASRVNVTINGIPYNDSESQSTFWVDIPDIASSTQSVQIQRGVGTSTNGAGAFGASINLQTTSVNVDPYVDLIAAGGSFNTQRYTVRAGTGLIKDHWSLDVKGSRITSNGYVERASSNLNSYYVSAGYHSDKTMIKAIVFGGLEKTYQSWYGVDETTLQTNRRMNYAGALYDVNGNISSYYNNQVDDYRQDHYQLHASHQFNSKWSATASLHYTYGSGFYEEYLQTRPFVTIGQPDVILPDTTFTASDMVVRKWLDNNFYGGTFGIYYQGEKSLLLLGGAVHQYSPARHYGEVIWSQVAASMTPYSYYDGHSEKGDRNIFLKWNYKLNDKLTSFVDVQYRGVNYTTSGTRDDQSSYAVDDRFDFFNPKAGLSYQLSAKNFLYASYAIANREPNRSDYLEGTSQPRPERLNNLELGLRRNATQYAFDVNYFLMQYTDQLVQTGAIDNAGYPIRANVGNSYRTGLEVSGSIRLGNAWSWNANLTWSVNQNKDYIVFENNVPVPRDTKIILSPGIIAGSQLAWRPFAGMEAAWLSKYVGSQYLDNTESASISLSDYWINDLRLSYEISPKGFTSIGWSVLTNNVLDVVYSSNGYSYGGVPYYFPQAGRNFMAMMTIKF